MTVKQVLYIYVCWCISFTNISSFILEVFTVLFFKIFKVFYFTCFFLFFFSFCSRLFLFVPFLSVQFSSFFLSCLQFVFCSISSSTKCHLVVNDPQLVQAAENLLLLSLTQTQRQDSNSQSFHSFIFNNSAVDSDQRRIPAYRG